MTKGWLSVSEERVGLPASPADPSSPGGAAPSLPGTDAERRSRVLWRAAWADALRATSLGWDVALPIAVGGLLGNWLERRLGVGYPLTPGLVALGLMVGVYNAGRTLSREIQRDKWIAQCEKDEEDESCRPPQNSA